MRHTIVHKMFSVGLALLVFVSTLSFTVEKHFCGTTLVDVALFSQAQGCGMEMPSTAQKSCCKNEIDLIKGQDELKFSFSDLDLEHENVVSTIFLFDAHSYEGSALKLVPSEEYAPPNLHYDRQVLHQVFLI